MNGLVEAVPSSLYADPCSRRATGGQYFRLNACLSRNNCQLRLEFHRRSICSYQSREAESSGEIISHKIRRQTVDEAGRIAFLTYGSTTDTDDPLLVYPEQIIGRYQGRIPKLELFINFLRTVPGYLLFIFLPFMILIVSESIHAVRLYKQYRQELRENEVLNQATTVDPAEYERMKRELEELKAKVD